MSLHHTRLALSLIAALSSFTAGQNESPNAQPVQEPAPSTPAKFVDPMASFARMVSGEWRTTLVDGRTFTATWHWGPGRHSIRIADTVDVYYWHPGRKQVCLLSLSPFAHGVSEGTIQFEGETADAVFDLYQTNDLRKMGLHWAFDGPDKYHETLLEATGPDGLKPMNGWDHVRAQTHTAARPPTADEAPKPSEHLKGLESLLGHTWEARGDRATGEALHLLATFERIPDVDAIYARVLAPTQDGEPTHWLDAYFYHHTGTDTLRCLALSRWGGVYEGDWTVLEGGALQLDLKGYDGDRVVPHLASLDFEKDGTLRNRLWSVEGTDRKLMLDVHTKKLAPKKD